MSYKTGCLICGFELTYLPAEETLSCEYCGKLFASEACCVNHHYVCDRCHALSANDLIEQFCRTTLLTDPFRIAATLMKNPQIKMHGPEHHFLVPAALLAAWYNRHKNVLRKDAAIITARRRAEDVKGGFCGIPWCLRGRDRVRDIYQHYYRRNAAGERGMAAGKPHERGKPQSHSGKRRTPVLQARFIYCHHSRSQVSQGAFRNRIAP